MPDFSRLIQFLGGWTLNINGLIAAGDRRLAELLAEGDRSAAEVPELAPEWQTMRAQLVAEWAEERAQMEAARDNPETAARIQSGVVEAFATLVNRHGEVGKPHGHAG